MKTLSILLLALVSTSTAIADSGAHPGTVGKPDVKQVKDVVTRFSVNLLGSQTAKPNPKAALALVDGSFWYDGFVYESGDEAADKACKKQWSAKGTVKDAKIEAFLPCVASASWSGALDGEAKWTAVNVKKLPAPFKKHKAALAKLAKDHALVMSHFIPAGPAEYWNLYVARMDDEGNVMLRGLLTVNKVYNE